MRSRLADRSGFAGLGVGGRATIAGYGILAGARALSLILLAQAVADGITAVVAHGGQWRSAIGLGIVGAVMRAAVAWATRVFAARSALATKQQLRRQLVDRMLDDGDNPTGAATVLAARGLDELDSYYRSVLPAITAAAVVPLFVGVRLFFTDWLSAAIVAATIILVPIFMALIGSRTREQTRDASAALQRLSDHLVELAKGLPVLVGLGRAEEQAAALATISQDYRAKTMKTLRVAFLSSLALELISTISVAVVAVTIGFRLVWGDVGLEVALVVLILAPECFTPFRDLGAAFHASQNGLDAFARARAILARSRRIPVARGARGSGVDALTVRFVDRSTDAIHDLSFAVPRWHITALQGESGAGKSTVLGVLADELRSGPGVAIAGTISGLDGDAIAWLPQRPRFTEGSVRAELELYAAPGEDNVVPIRTLAEELDIVSLLDVDPEQLSPGEARRVAFTRVCLRVEAGATLVLLDEPTAHLDAANAERVARIIDGFRGRATVVLASHDERVNELADHVVGIGRATSFRSADIDADSDGTVDAWKPRSPAVSPAASAGSYSDGDQAIRQLLRFLRPAAKRYLAAAALGTLAAGFAIALIAVSGWLIVKASEHPSIMYLGVAIVGVRFFGIGRSALHYAERLVTHDAVFDSVTALRLDLWNAFTRRGATSRKLLGGSSVLDRLVGSADEVRDLAPRVLIPASVGLLTGTAVLVTVGALDGRLVWLFAACLTACLVVAPAVTNLTDRRAGVQKQDHQSVVLRRIAATLAAAGDLRANGVAGRAAGRILRDDIVTGRDARRSFWALGAGNAIIVVSCGVTAVLTFAWTSADVIHSGLAVELVAVLALLPLALIDPFVASMEAIQLWPSLRFELVRVREATETTVETTSGDLLPLGHVREIDLSGLGASWPGAAQQAFGGLTARLRPGDWLIVEGPSGAGKSTLLSVLLGYLKPDEGHYRLNGIDSTSIGGGSIRHRVAWAPQDGYLFDSSLRANLLISRPRGDAPGEAEMRNALAEVGLSSLMHSLTGGLETMVGAGGSELSGGQRQRVVIARTLLTRADVVLLDEPTAHLDAIAARELLADLRAAFSDKIVVMVTHHHDDREPEDTVLTLGALAASGSPIRELV